MILKDSLDATHLVPVVAAIGFGIQQFLQVLAEPIVSITIGLLKDKFSKKRSGEPVLLPGGISDVDAKKVMLGFISFTLGLAIALSTKKIRVLEAADLDMVPRWDLFITALTISAGTEGVNSVMKLAQYVKDAVRKQTPPSVAQNSPVPQAPTSNLSPVGIFAGLNDPKLIDSDVTEAHIDVLSRAKEEDHDA